MSCEKVLDPKIINTQAENSWTGDMFEHARRARDRVISSSFEMCTKLVICKDGGLRKAIHTLVDLTVDMVVMEHILELITLYDVMGDKAAMNGHVLRMWHG